MKDDAFKELMQKSLIETSPDFSDKVIAQIELRKVKRLTPLWTLKSICTIIVGSFLGVIFIILNYPDDSFNLMPNQVTVSRLHVLLLVLLLFLYAINFVLKITKEFKNFKSSLL